MKAKSEPIKTILIISTGFIVVFLITHARWAIMVSLIVALAGLSSTYLAKQINFLWLKLSDALSLIVPNIILGSFFYLVLFPISLLSRLFRKQNPLILSNNLASTYKEVNKTFDKSKFEFPW